MALVVFLRGVNVGGHRTFRPSVLAKELRQYEVVNVGAAGTFVVRGRVTKAALHAALRDRLPFDTHVMISRGSDVLRLVASDPLMNEPRGADIVPFVSVLAANRPPASPLPRQYPPSGPWEMRVVGQQGRFVFGIYRRQMKAIGHLGQIDRLFGVPVTTRNWSTILTIARVLEPSRQPRGEQRAVQ